MRSAQGSEICAAFSAIESRSLRISPAGKSRAKNALGKAVNESQRLIVALASGEAKLTSPKLMLAKG